MESEDEVGPPYHGEEEEHDYKERVSKPEDFVEPEEQNFFH